MKRTIATILAVTALAWAPVASAQRCGPTSCGGVVFPPMFASLLGLVLSE